MGQGVAETRVSRSAIVLRRGIEPVSLDKSTFFMGFPKNPGGPKRLTASPLNATCVPGCTKAISIGISGWVFAEPNPRNVRRNNRTIKFLFNFMPSFTNLQIIILGKEFKVVAIVLRQQKKWGNSSLFKIVVSKDRVPNSFQTGWITEGPHGLAENANDHRRVWGLPEKLIFGRIHE
jgi:hypothetical protein